MQRKQYPWFLKVPSSSSCRKLTLQILFFFFSFKKKEKISLYWPLVFNIRHDLLPVLNSYMQNLFVKSGFTMNKRNLEITVIYLDLSSYHFLIYQLKIFEVINPVLLFNMQIIIKVITFPCCLIYNLCLVVTKLRVRVFSFKV